MNKKLLAVIAATLAALVASPVLAGDEDDDLEVTMDVIDNLEQVSAFIIVIGQVDAPDSASEESRQREPWDDKDRFRDSDVVGFDEIDERDDSDEMEELDLRQEEERDAPEEQESDVSIHDEVPTRNYFNKPV